jgi:hypothetical protein
LRHASLERRDARLLVLQCEAEAAGDWELCERIVGIMLKFVQYGHDLEWQIATTPARTREGLAAKARVALTRVDVSRDGTPKAVHALLWSICRDVLGEDAVAQDTSMNGDFGKVTS